MYKSLLKLQKMNVIEASLIPNCYVTYFQKWWYEWLKWALQN